MEQMIIDLQEQLTHTQQQNIEQGKMLDKVIAERDDLLQARAICPSCAKRIDEAAEVDVAALNTKLAESQADNAKLREASKRIANGPWPDSCEGPEDQCRFDESIAKTALALPSDTTALNERLKAERERVLQFLFDEGVLSADGTVAAAIREMK